MKLGDMRKSLLKQVEAALDPAQIRLRLKRVGTKVELISRRTAQAPQAKVWRQPKQAKRRDQGADAGGKACKKPLSRRRP